jgi:hypothetical protein
VKLLLRSERNLFACCKKYNEHFAQQNRKSRQESGASIFESKVIRSIDARSHALWVHHSLPNASFSHQNAFEKSFTLGASSSADRRFSFRERSLLSICAAHTHFFASQSLFSII